MVLRRRCLRADLLRPEMPSDNVRAKAIGGILMRADFGRGSVAKRLAVGGRLRARLLSALFVVAAFLFVGQDARASVAVGATATASGTATLTVTSATANWSATTASGSLLVAILTYNGTPTIGAV